MEIWYRYHSEQQTNDICLQAKQVWWKSGWEGMREQHVNDTASAMLRLTDLEHAYNSVLCDEQSVIWASDLV